MKIQQLQRIPSCITVMQQMRDELVSYRQIASLEILKPALEQMDLWTFWKSNALSLPNYFIAAYTVALVPRSSADCDIDYLLD